MDQINIQIDDQCGDVEVLLAEKGQSGIGEHWEIDEQTLDQGIGLGVTRQEMDSRFLLVTNSVRRAKEKEQMYF